MSLYLDSLSQSYTGSSLLGTLLPIPNVGTQTTITSGNHSNSTIQIASLVAATGTSIVTTIPGGIWNMLLFSSSSSNTDVSYYFNAGYVDSDGVSNKVIFATGSNASSTNIQTSQGVYTNNVYVPVTVLPNISKRIILDIYLTFVGNNRNATLYFRDNTQSLVNTSLQIAAPLAGGSDQQILFNSLGIATGSSNLTYNYNTNQMTLSGTGYTHSLIPTSEDIYTLGTPDARYNHLYVGTGSISIGNVQLSSSGNTLLFNGNIYPTSNNLNLGSFDNPWKSIYVSTGTVFLGKTGALQLNNNGLMSSLGGFASPYLQVGNTNPGQGILLYENQNKLFYQNELGESGPVSVFNVSPNNINNYFFTGGNVGFNTSSPSYILDVNGTGHFTNIIIDNITGALNGLPTIHGETGPTGPQGITGPRGSGNDVLTLYLNSISQSYTGTVINGTLDLIATQGTQTQITTQNHSNITLLISSFISPVENIVYPYIHNGFWDMHLYSIANTNNSVSYYFNAGYVDSDGVSNKIIFATGSSSSATLLSNKLNVYSYSLYVPSITLPDYTKRIVTDIYI